MLMPGVLLASFSGLILNMSFSGSVAQPDWSLAILLAVLLSNYKTWCWVLPSIWVHDIVFFWSGWVAFPYFICIAMILLYSDKRLGPGQPQRWLSLLLGCLPLYIAGVSQLSCLLTALLAIWLWALFSSHKEKVYVEPA